MIAKKWLNKWKSQYYVFLLPLFFTIHGYNENFALIPILIVLHLFFRYLVIALAIFVLSLFLFRNESKAGLFSFFLLCIFFFFGTFYDSLKLLFSNGRIASYSILLPAIGILVILVLILIKRTKRKKGNIIRYLGSVMLVITALELLSLFFNIVTDKASKNSIAKQRVELIKSKSSDSNNKPDIYFIVLDEYTSSGSLKEEFKFNNDALDSLFKSKDFFVSKTSNSNYNMTPFSVASILNLNYLKSGIENRFISRKVFVKAVETLKSAELIQFLNEEGYTIKNYSCFDFNGSPTAVKPYFYNDYYNLINNQTIVSRIKRDIGWNFSTRHIFSRTFKLPADYKKNKQYHLYRNKYNWENLMYESARNCDTPRFVYTHLMLPHEPFYLKADGSKVSDTLIIQNTIDPKEGYINQVIYSNSLLGKLIPIISKKSKRPKIVIIQGDHGFKFYGLNYPPQKMFNILNVYYFSDKDYSKLYDGISPVNSFRVILNKYFGQSLPLLKDSSVFLVDSAYIKN